VEVVLGLIGRDIGFLMNDFQQFPRRGHFTQIRPSALSNMAGSSWMASSCA
jgi:hypothetical protein